MLRHLKFILGPCFLFLFSFGLVHAQDVHLQGQARTLVNLLDYISQDYVNAVKDGKVIDEGEYLEMTEFSQEAASLLDSINKKRPLANVVALRREISSIRQHIKEKQPLETIATPAQKVKRQIMALHLFELSPSRYPDIANGRKLYLAHCQSCHGATGAGNGPAGLQLEPPPSDFLGDPKMKDVSPLQVYNTTRLGVAETGMRAFTELSDDEVWALAFYIKSLPMAKANGESQEEIEKKYKQLKGTYPLSEISHLSDKELQDLLMAEDKTDGLRLIRLHRPANDKATSLSIAVSDLNKALEAYRANNKALAGQKALTAYLEGIEPVEQQLRTFDSKIVNELEAKMIKVRQSIRQDRPVEVVEASVIDAKNSISKASELLGEQTYTFWLSFLIAASILLREGLEAVLIIVTILGLLRSLKAEKAIKWVHGGWILAVLVGGGSWFFTEWLMAFGGKNREMMEGVGALFAVLILIYVGFWLHNKTDARKWQQFIKVRIRHLIDNKKMFGLGLISFVVVFREAFESILFLSSMQMQAEDTSKHGVWMGAVTAILLVLIIAYILLKTTKKIPIRQMFQYSAVIIMILAVILVGQGVHAFQEAGMITITSLPMNFHAAMLGIFPTVETYAAQISVLALLLWMNYRQKKII